MVICKSDDTFRQLPDGVGTGGVVAEVPQIPIVNFHGRMQQFSRRSETAMQAFGDSQAGWVRLLGWLGWLWLRKGLLHLLL